jgi:hypothetical protein
MKSSAIKTQNNQAMPAGGRLWTPTNIGNDLKLWLRPEAIRPHNGESTSVSDLRLNRWFDSSSFGSTMGPFDESASVLPSAIQMLKANLVSAGNGTTFGSLNSRKFDTFRASSGGGGSIPDAAAPQIDPGTGAFTVLTVFRITRQDSASVPYDSDSMIIMSDGTGAIASNYILQVDVNSNTSSSPSFVKIKSVMGGDTLTTTLEEKSGLSQIFDNEEFLVAYERDGAASGFFYNNGSFLQSQTGQAADMSDNKPRNIHMKISAEFGGGFVASSDNCSHDIAEIILINKKDATTRILCEGYLAHKYGRQNKLSATHKYRYGPPRV